MLKNYLKISIRNILRNRSYSLINIAGLAVGMACFILISLWVQDEISYDRFHENIDNLYRVIDYEKYSNGEEVFFSQNAAILGPTLKSKYPEVSEFTRYRRGSNTIVQYGDKQFTEEGFAFTDPSFFELFSYPVLKGNKENFLSDPYSIAISEEMAQKYFGDEDAIGKILRIDNRIDFKVSGILKKAPSNSHLQFKFIIPFETIKEFGANLEGWRSWAYATYILLNKNADYKELNRKIKNVIKEHENDAIATISLQPLTDIHLYSSHIWGLGGDGEIKYVYIFSAIALLILLTACINFMNLATASSSKRAKEVGLRKVVGANRKEIIVQFLNESLILSFIALLFSLSFVSIVLPYFNELSGKELAFSPAGNLNIIILIVTTVIATGIISGSYPALFLSSFQPVKVLKGTLISGAKGANFRRLLVSFQFVLTILLIFGTLVINRQLQFIHNQKLGFEKDNVISISLPKNIRQSALLLKNEFSKNSDILEISAAEAPPNRMRASRIYRDWEGHNPDEQFLGYFFATDEKYQGTLQLQMAAGRYFSKDYTSDSGAVVINQAAMRVMGMKEPVGKTLGEHKIIGVLKDYHFESLHNKIVPLIIYNDANEYRYLLVKIRPENLGPALASLEQSWKVLVPGYPFNYKFLEEYNKRMYLADQRIEKIINVFTFLALFIACLGLFGLTSFVVEQRTKEIGVRKVLGASIPGILILLSKEFIKWILVATVIAWPVGWLVMDSWLQTFAYKTNLNIWMLMLSGAAVLIIALITVSSQSIKASLANPVEALRYE